MSGAADEWERKAETTLKIQEVCRWTEGGRETAGSLSPFSLSLSLSLSFPETCGGRLKYGRAAKNCESYGPAEIAKERATTRTISG